MKMRNVQNVFLFKMLIALFAVSATYAQLTVSSHTPIQNQHDIPVTSDIVVTFSTNINSSTINSGSFTVNGSNTGKIAGAYSVVNNVATFDPTSDFRTGEIITVCLTTGIENTSAVPLGNEYTWHFTVKSETGYEITDSDTISNVIESPQAIYAADIDSDGDLDVVSSSFSDDKIYWFENNGSESFTAHLVSDTVDNASSVRCADIDSDGNMDILTSINDNADEIVWYKNDGSENFDEHLIASPGANINDVANADIDSDGDMDVLAAINGGSAWYENNGSESFTEHSISTYTGVGIRAWDMNADGFMDILEVQSGAIVLHENDGSESFTADTIVDPAGSGLKISVADIDSDGDMDIVTSSVTSDTVAWHENTGTKSFTEHVLTNTANSARSAYAADFDGDGDIDILYSAYYDKKVAWFENDGNENFTEHVISSVDWGITGAIAADLEDDGDMDVLSFSTYSGSSDISWYKNVSLNVTSHGSNTVAPEGSFIVSFSRDIDASSVNENSFLATGSVSGKITGTYTVWDHYAELQPSDSLWPSEIVTITLTTGISSTGGTALSVPYTWESEVWHTPGSGLFIPRPDISTIATSASDVHATDINGDGYLDVLSASLGSNKIAWYENDGAESFTEHGISTTAVQVTSVYAVDIDYDGDIDVLTSAISGNKIAWYENNGSGTFTENTITTTANEATSIYSIDLDADGDIDVLSASQLDDKIAWYENNGSESFTEYIISTSADSASCVYAADVDEDGDIDVLSASKGDDKIAWYENNGKQVFSEHIVTTNADGAMCVFVYDLDHDQGSYDNDILSASFHDDKISWYENDGSESFSEHIISTTVDGAVSVFVRNIDNTGGEDVFAASSNDDKIIWFENDYDENFTEHTITSGADSVSSICLADLNHDGKIDVLSSSMNDNRIVWYENDPTYTIAFWVNGVGNIAGPDTQTVSHGGDAETVEANPGYGYHFVDWSDGVTDSIRTETNVTADHSASANFEINVYTLEYSAGPNGVLSGETSQEVAHGSDGLAVYAVPLNGSMYHFADWSDGSTENPRADSNVTADITVTANFALNTYTLTYTSNTNGNITGETPQIVAYGSSGTAVEVVPKTGCHFVGWDDGRTDNPRIDANVLADISVEARCDINTYTLTYTAGTNGSITGTTPQTINHGSDGSAVEAVPDANYHFVDWSDGSTTNPRADTDVVADVTVTANFAINTYTLTYTAGANGSITGTTPQTIDHGSDGSAVEAVPNTGYHFVDWSDGSTANPRTELNVTANTSVTANFAINVHTLTYTAGANGTISGTSPQNVNYGSNGSAVTAVPNTGYHFVNWSDGSTANPRTEMNVTTDIFVSANFAINVYTLTYTAGTNGTISGTSPQNVNHGGNGTAVTAVPNTGYHFVNWSDGRMDNPRTDMAVIANILVTAIFDITTYITGPHNTDNSLVPLGIQPVPNPVDLNRKYVDIIVTAGAVASEVRLVILDALGNLVNEQYSTMGFRGTHQLKWNLRNRYGILVGSGNYKAIAVVKYKDRSVRKFSNLIGIKK